uniref:U8-agatoxin-Ao1a n=1 Tax=Agelena orientalis TaxID=293813 RepID=TX20A_AGEOR|nr:RecName: Full=U8-agatoxin-Ao1a; Short=U8-AGTX-Ao1a; AltName: Full=AgorTX_B6; Flags: Precursor [Agelena orientalis]AAU93682.1 toxin-like structure AgorTX_B6 precursor [Agelena orientalis]
MKSLLFVTIAVYFVAQAVTANLLSNFLGSSLIDDDKGNMHKLYKRSEDQCIGRSCTCDTSSTSCCPYAACRCNLWKTSCKCQRTGRKWATPCKEIYSPN